MNRLLTDYYPTFRLYQALRRQLLELLSDEDLAFKPGGENVTLGELCRAIGETESSYIQSFRTFSQDFSYRNNEPGLESSKKVLVDWFLALDNELQAVIESFSDQELDSLIIDRGGGFKVRVPMQLEIYKEALLIFYGKVSVYMKAMGTPLPPQWQEWIE